MRLLQEFKTQGIAMFAALKSFRGCSDKNVKQMEPLCLAISGLSLPAKELVRLN